MAFICPGPDLTHIKERASQLGDHVVLQRKVPSKYVISPIVLEQMNQELFTSKLAQHREPTFDESIDVSGSNLCDIFYECTDKSVIRKPVSNVDITVNRWERLLSENDSAKIWRAINWHGELQTNITDSSNTSPPSEEEFIEHITQLCDHPIDDRES